MLTSCPKCHHLFIQPSYPPPPQTTTTTTTSTTTTTTGTNLQVTTSSMSPSPSICCTNTSIEDNLTISRRQCCPSVITLNVPACAMSGWTGGSVILQKENTQNPKSISPEPSPSIPLSFVLPTTPSTVFVSSTTSERWNFSLPQVPSIPQSEPQVLSTPQSEIPQVPTTPQSEIDLRILSSTLKALKNSGWYYEGLSWQESVPLLMPTSPGTFLVRDSSDPRYLFSLSVQTDRGPTSVRLHYSNGHFRLDAEPKLADIMPQFDCVVKLIEYYIKFTKDNLTLEHRKKKIKSKDQVWIDSTGQMYSNILLTKPLYQKERFPSLQHLSRLVINKLAVNNRLSVPNSNSSYSLLLPLSLKEYLNEYPYTC